MNRNSIIPQSTRSRCPFEADLDINILFVDVVEVAKDEVGFGFVETDDAGCHSAVYEERFPACGGVDADQWMNTLDTLGSSFWIISVEIRVCRNVHGFFAIDELAEVWGELFISAVTARPESISSDRWYSVIMQMRITSWLSLVNEIAESKVLAQHVFTIQV